MDSDKYRIGELADKAGVTRRTVHYYLGRGLLPPAEGAGLGTFYSEEHLLRIILIKKLQEAYLPLDEIKKKLDHMTLEEVKNANEYDDFPVILKESQAQYELQVQNQTGKGLGIVYERTPIGYGVEIHFPANNEKARDIVEKLYRYAMNIIKEG